MRLTAAFALTLLPALAMAGPACAGEMPAPPSARPDAQVQGPAHASGHTAPKPSQAKSSRASSSPGKSEAVDAPPAGTQAQAAPLDPRWVAPRTRIKGLVVWIYTPGHFQRD